MRHTEVLYAMCGRTCGLITIPPIVMIEYVPIAYPAADTRMLHMPITSGSEPLTVCPQNSKMAGRWTLGEKQVSWPGDS